MLLNAEDRQFLIKVAGLNPLDSEPHQTDVDELIYLARDILHAEVHETCDVRNGLVKRIHRRRGTKAARKLPKRRALTAQSVNRNSRKKRT